MCKEGDTCQAKIRECPKKNVRENVVSILKKKKDMT